MAKKIPMNTLEHVLYGGLIDLDGLNFYYNGTKCQWRKPYAITIPSLPTGVAGITVTRSASESSCSQLPETPSAITDGKVLYGDILTLSGTAEEGYNDPVLSVSNGLSGMLCALQFNTTIAPDVYNEFIGFGKKSTLIKVGEAISTIIQDGIKTTTIIDKGLKAQNFDDPPQAELVWWNTNYNTIVMNIDENKYRIDGVEYTPEEAEELFTATETIVYRQYSDFWANNGKPTGWLVNELTFDSPLPIVRLNDQDLWESYVTIDTNITPITGRVIGNVAVGVTAGRGKTYYVYYNKGTSTSGTLPSTTSRTYPNAATIATNNMAKSNTTANSYTVTYANGTATSGTLPSAQTSINTTTYTKNGWTTGASNYNDPDYANGASFGANSTTNLTLYPNFTTSTTNGGVTLGTNNMSKSNTTANSYTVTYAQGNASNTTNLPSKQTSINTTVYTKNGWTTTSGSTTQSYADGATLSIEDANTADNLTLYPCFSQSTTNGGVTLSSNTMSRSATTEDGYKVTYAKGTATSTTVPSAQTIKNTRSYTHNGWATSASGSKTYNKGAATGALSQNLTLYPYFDSSVTKGTVNLATNSMTKSNTEANSYTVTYANGTATSGTLPATQTSVNTTTYTANGWTTSSSGYNDRDYANGASYGTSATGNITLYPNFTTSTTNGGVTLGTNNMTKSNTTANSYTVTYAQGNASSTANLPSTQTSINTTTYTKNGWTTTSGSTTKTHANGAATGALTGNLTLYPCFSQSTTNGGITFASNTMSKNSTTEPGGTVTYAKGTATSTTVPAAQTATNTREYTANGWTRSQNGDKNFTSGGTLSTLSENLTLYPYFSSQVAIGGVTLASNTMTKNNTTADSYTVTYAQGNASNTTNLPSKQTSVNTTVYTANGWTNTSGSTTRDYRNGLSIQVPNDITIYPCFSQSTTNGGVTVSSNTMSRSNTTENGYTVTYNKGTATSTSVPSAQTATDTRSYTHSGWATSASGSKAYNKGASTGALSSSITLYPYFDSSVTRGSVTLATNSMTKSSTNDYSYTVTYNYNGSGAANTTATATKTRTYTANGWTTTSGSTTRTYTNGQSVQMTEAITVYPCFSESTSGGSVTLPTPTRANYTFKGWSTSSTATSGLTGSYTPTANVTLYAIWEAAGTTTSLPIVFPAIPMRTVTAFTQADGSNRIFVTTEETEYSGFGDYDECVIDGITVGETYTTIKTQGGVLSTTTYRAKFTGGTLYVLTRAEGEALNTVTSTKLSAASYSTTATLSGGAKPQLSLGEQDVNRGPTFNDATDTVEVNFDNPNPVAVTAYIDITFGDGSTALSTSRTIAANGSIDLELQVSSSYDQDMGDMEVYLVDPTGTYLDSEPLVIYVS